MKHYGDITKINGAAVEPVDVVIGGSPCQDLSVAGRQAGLTGERSGLFMEQLRIIKEMRRADIERGHTGQSIRPRYMVWENVPGAFSSNKGEDFGIVLKETVAVVCREAPAIPKPGKGWPNAGCLSDVGGQWSVAWRVFDAQFWGVPQRRKRIALVADFGGMSAPEILFERQGVSRDTKPGGAERKGIAGAVETSSALSNSEVCCLPVKAIENANGNASGGYSLNSLPCVWVAIGADLYNHEITGDIVSTLTAVGAGDATKSGPSLILGVADGFSVRRLTPLECERLQGFPDNWTDIGPWKDSKGKLHKECSDSARYKAIGNSIALPSWAWVLERLSSYCGEKPTMASLFDGIGGFPLIWGRINGKGTCIWASEIEEFPMAVTRYHFSEGKDDENE